MRRRQFLQLAGSAAAGAMVAHASPLSPGIVVTTTSHNTVVVTNLIGFPNYALGVSGWISREQPLDVIHVMLEKRPEAPWSHPRFELPELKPGRYRLRMMNATPSTLAVHLPGHRVELAHYSVVEADLIAGA